jgi:predicted Zn-dependent protease
MPPAPHPERPALPDEVAWGLERAEGYLDLKMTGPARRELDRIPAAYHAHPAFLSVRLQAALAGEHWAEAAELAGLLRQLEPGEPIHLIQLAYATRRAKGIEEARMLLLEALKTFPDVDVIPYNLACYECQLGNLEASLEYLGRATAKDARWREIALEDEDLKAIWPRLET